MSTILAIDPLFKTCKRCRVTFPIANFNQQEHGKNGRTARCKQCFREVYYLPHKQRRLEEARKRRATQEGAERERVWRNQYRRTHRLKRLLQEAKTRAVRRGFAFDIKESDLSIPATCPVLGIPITLLAERRADGSPSLERIDRNKGYVRGNTIVISWRANRIKSDATLEELEAITAFYRKRPI